MKKKRLICLINIFIVSSLLACGGKEGGKSFFCRCIERFTLRGMEFGFTGLDLPKEAGCPFYLTITATKDDFSKEVFLKDASNTIEPKEIILKNGFWQGSITIKKSGTTSITVFYDKISSESRDFFVSPSFPARFIIQPESYLKVKPKGTITIIARLVDDYGNPIQGVKCRLKPIISEGKKGRLSSSFLTTDKNGEVSTIYTLPSYHLGRIKIETLDSPTIFSFSGTITTTKER